MSRDLVATYAILAVLVIAMLLIWRYDRGE